MTDSIPPAPPSQPPTVGNREAEATAESPYRTPETGGTTEVPKTSGLAIAGFVLALIPLFCVNIIGVGLGIAALVKISSQPKILKGQGLAIASIVIGLGWFVVGVLAAIAIPNFIAFQGRAKQAEAKSNLKAIFVAAKSNHAEMGRMGETLDAIGWAPSGGNRYTYYFGDSRAEPDAASPEALPETVDSYARPESGEFRAVAVGNIDTDDTLDVWAITDANELTQVIDDLHE